MPEPFEKTKYGVTITLNDFNQKSFELYQKAVVIASRDAFVSFDGGNGVSASAHVNGETVREAARQWDHRRRRSKTGRRHEALRREMDRRRGQGSYQGDDD